MRAADGIAGPVDTVIGTGGVTSRRAGRGPASSSSH